MKRSNPEYYKIITGILNTGYYGKFKFINPNYTTLSSDKVDLVCPICKQQYVETNIDAVLSGEKDRCDSCLKIQKYSDIINNGSGLVGIVLVNKYNACFEILKDIVKDNLPYLKVRNINIGTEFDIPYEDYKTTLEEKIIGSEGINSQGIHWVVLGFDLEKQGRFKYYTVQFSDGTKISAMKRSIVSGTILHPEIEKGIGIINGYNLVGESFKQGIHVFYTCEDKEQLSIKSMDEMLNQRYTVLKSGIEHLGDLSDNYYKLRCPTCGRIVRWKSKRVEKGKIRPVYLASISSGGCKSCASTKNNVKSAQERYKNQEITKISNSGEIVSILGISNKKHYLLVQFESGFICKVHASALSTGAFIEPLIKYEPGDLYTDNYGVDYTIVEVDKSTDTITIKCNKTGKVINNMYTICLNTGNYIDYSKEVMTGYSFSLSDGREIEIGQINSPSDYYIYVDGIKYHIQKHIECLLGDFINSDPVDLINRTIVYHNVGLYKELPNVRVAHIAFWSKEGFWVEVIKRKQRRNYLVNIWGDECEVEIPSLTKVTISTGGYVLGLPYISTDKRYKYLFKNWCLIDEVLNEGDSNVFYYCRRVDGSTFHCLRPVDIVNIELGNGILEELDRKDIDVSCTSRIWGRHCTSKEGTPYIIQEVYESGRGLILVNGKEEVECSIFNASKGGISLSALPLLNSANYNSQGFLVTKLNWVGGSHYSVKFFDDFTMTVFGSSEKDEFGNWYRGFLYPKAKQNAEYFEYKGYTFYDKCNYFGKENAYFLCTRDGLNDVICLRPIDAYNISKGIITEDEVIKVNSKYYKEPDRWSIGKTGISKDGFWFKVIGRIVLNLESRHAKYTVVFKDGKTKDVEPYMLSGNSVSYFGRYPKKENYRGYIYIGKNKEKFREGEDTAWMNWLSPENKEVTLRPKDIDVFYDSIAT